jgi:hypothetical protein
MKSRSSTDDETKFFITHLETIFRLEDVRGTGLLSLLSLCVMCVLALAIY